VIPRSKWVVASGLGWGEIVAQDESVMEAMKKVPLVKKFNKGFLFE
jgi:hypothetical protein